MGRSGSTLKGSSGARNKRNWLINGDMGISQRGTSFVSPSDAYTLDRFRYIKTGAMTHTISQDTDVPTLAQAGYLFKNSLRLNLTGADTSIAVGDYTVVSQRIEGYNFSNFAQKDFTLSFWVKATLVGTYCIAFRNNGLDRCYIAEYTINTTNTWEKKTVSVPASPSAGTWNYTNGVGLEVLWTLAAGSNFQSPANSWQTADDFATSNQINGTNTGATDFRITGAMLNEGSFASPFKLFGESVDGELVACQRYYEKSFLQGTTPATGAGRTSATEYPASIAGAGAIQGCRVEYKVMKRTSPLLTFYNPVSANAFARNVSASTDSTNTTAEAQGDRGFTLLVTGLAGWTEAATISVHWSVEADL